MNQPIEVTWQNVRQHLRDIAAENPGKVAEKRIVGTSTPSCMYLHNDCPDCIIGHLLVRYGVPKELIAGFEIETARTVFHALFETGYFKNEDATERFLICDLVQVIQENQDEGARWGTVVSLLGPL